MSQDLVKTLFDRESMNLFLEVVKNHETGDIYMSNLHLSRKQFYDRMSNLRKSGLVVRNGGTIYKVTSFGLIINHVIEMIAEAEKQRWKYEVIDNTADLETRHKLRETLLNEQELKQLELLVCAHK